MAEMLTSVAACGSEAEDAVEATTAAFDELADRLADISTAEQLAAAQADLRDIGGKIKAAMEGMKVLDDLSAADNQAVGEKLGPQMAAARQRAFAEIERIGGTIDPLAEDRINAALGVE
jgi:hypothetical protein